MESQLPQSDQTQNYAYIDDYMMRRDLAKDFKWFCVIYLAHHFKLEPASFHHELTSLLSNHDEKFLEVIGFRGSAKSTFGSLAFILWAALEHPKLYDFIIPVADTSTQAKLNMANIKNELDNNWLIKHDYGVMKTNSKEPNPEPDLESDEEWQAQNVLLANGVRILCRSRGQKMRGLKHRASRPKLIVVDDPEDREWVKTKENRDKTDQWMRGEVIPCRAQDGRIITIGNWLHEDALMARLKKTGIFKVKEFSLIENGYCTWAARYPTQKALDDERTLAGETAWRREYLLQIVPEDGAVITENDITFYDDEPYGNLDQTGHGVDLAISKSSSADYTSEVQGECRYDEQNRRTNIFILPNPLNKRLNFLETINYFIAQSKKDGGHLFFVEKVAYQQAAIEELERNGVPVIPMPSTTDKRSRLITASPYIKNGTVKFPRHGCEDLLAQLYGFGVETHDDMVDALTSLILGLAKTGLGFTPIQSVDTGFGPQRERLSTDPLNEDATKNDIVNSNVKTPRT